MRNHFAAALIFSALVLAPAIAADVPSAEALLQRFADSTGTPAAIAAIHNARMTGSVEITGMGISGKAEIVEEGEKTWTAIDLQGLGRIEQGFDGETAWEKNAIQGTRLIEGEEKSMMKRSSGFSLLTSWKDDYVSAKTVGESISGGKAAWKVEMTPKEGKPETFFFNKESGLLTGMSAVVTTALGDIPAEVLFSDYRRVGAITTAFTMTQKAMSQEIVMKFDRVEWNVPLPKDRFALPDDVRALLNKQQAK
jgi:hypothetical protein